MPQPVPKHIRETNNISEVKFNTLLIDGNNLLEISYNGDKRINEDGEHIGGIVQFFIKIKYLLSKYDFTYVYVFWDGDMSGQLRYNIYPAYKANRGKVYNSTNEYYRKIDEYCRRAIRKKQEENKEEFIKEKEFLMLALEELFIRQVVDYETEGDDLISYYVLNKKQNERIVILSGDRDLTQLISEDVIIFLPIEKEFLTVKNFKKFSNIHYKNVLLKKIICGDSSDNIKGIKGVGEGILIKNFPQISERPVTVEEIISEAKKIEENRKKNKQKPLKWVENIINSKTDGIQGDKIYEINRKIIDLNNPIMSDSAIKSMDDMMYSPLDPEGRSTENLYKMIMEKKIVDFIDSDKFSNFFIDFKYIAEKEIKKYNLEEKN